MARFELRVGDEELARWREEAALRLMPLGELVRSRMREPLRGDGAPVTAAVSSRAGDSQREVRPDPRVKR